MRARFLPVRRAAQRVLMLFGTGPTAAAASAYLTLKHRQRCRVTHDRGMWIHTFPDGVLVQTVIGGHTVQGLDRETHFATLYDYVPGAGDVVVDLGSGIGEELLTFSRLVGPTGRVISVEAHPTTYACLTEAVARNGLDNVTPIQAAVTEHDGVVSITDLGGTDLANTVVTDDHGIVVRAVRIDTLVDQVGIDRIDFLKVNIEGAERALVDTMDGVIDRVAHLSIECHDFLADRTGDDRFRTKQYVTAYLRQHGFTVIERVDARPEITSTIYARRAGETRSAQLQPTAERLPD